MHNLSFVIIINSLVNKSDKTYCDVKVDFSINIHAMILTIN